MKFNVHVTVRGRAGTREFPVTGNPLEAKTLSSLLVQVAERLPRNEELGLESVGIRIELAENTITDPEPTVYEAIAE